MPRRPCIVCGVLIKAGQGSRCPTHQRTYHHGERQEHERIITAHVAQHGYVCMGCPPHGDAPHPAHPTTNPLTVHHIVRVAAGGAREGGPKQVICRQGNTSLG